MHARALADKHFKVLQVLACGDQVVEAFALQAVCHLGLQYSPGKPDDCLGLAPITSGASLQPSTGSEDFVGSGGLAKLLGFAYPTLEHVLFV